MVTDPTWAAILTALAKPLAAEVVRHLRSELKTEQYDSRKHLPPGTSARQFRTTCKRIPEAFRAGAVWNCPITARPWPGSVVCDTVFLSLHTALLACVQITRRGGDPQA